MWAQDGWEWGAEKASQWKLHSFYSSPYVVRVIKSRLLTWAYHVARMEEGGGAFKILKSKPTGQIPRIILEWIINKQVSFRSV